MRRQNKGWDFWSQYIDMKQLRAERGKYNGKDYSMVVLRKVILYPLEAGAKTIEPFKIDLDAEVPTGRRDWFGEYEMRVIEKSLSTGTQTINVKSLPEKENQKAIQALLEISILM